MTSFVLLLALARPALSSVNPTEADKNLHLGMSYNLTAAGYHTLSSFGATKVKALAVSGGAVIVLGLLKEYVHDKRPDRDDVEANTWGTALALIVPFRIEF